MNWLSLLSSSAIVTLIATLGSYAVGRTGARSTVEGQKMQNSLDWRKQLQDELKDMRENNEKKIAELEQRIKNLESDGAMKARHLGIFGDFLDELGLFELYGRSDDEHPTPPAEVADYYDRQRWLRIKAAHDAKRPQQ